MKQIRHRYGEYRISLNSKVIIISPDMKKNLGTATYVGQEKRKLFGTLMNIPKFKLNNKIIRGFECWWIPACKVPQLQNDTTSGIPTCIHERSLNFLQRIPLKRNS